MRNLAATLAAVPGTQRRAPSPEHEWVRGWGVFALPFDSGHVLGLRVFPEGSFDPYHSVWHRDPEGRWSIYVAGAPLDAACPRYFGAACEHTAYAQIDVTWTGPATLRVSIDEPALDWTLTASATWVLGALNTVSRVLPAASWRPRSLVRARERMARTLGMGELALRGVMPSGHGGTLMPQQMYYVDESQAVLAGVDLGRPARLTDNPAIGSVPLPARGVLAIGGGIWTAM